MKFTEVSYKRYVKLRILATFIDYAIYWFVVFIYVVCFGKKNEDGGSEVTGLATLPIILLWFLYFVGTEAINQATPGHDLCKLVVIKSKGDKISLGDAFKRRILDAIDICFYGIPALICIYNTPRYQRLGDLFADTVVVRKSDIKQTEVAF